LAAIQSKLSVRDRNRRSAAANAGMVWLSGCGGNVSRDASVTVRLAASVSGRAGPRRWPDAHEGSRAKANSDSRFMGSYCGLMIPITL